MRKTMRRGTLLFLDFAMTLTAADWDWTLPNKRRPFFQTFGEREN